MQQLGPIAGHWLNRTFFGTGPASSLLYTVPFAQLLVLTSIMVVFNGGGSGGQMDIGLDTPAGTITLWLSDPASGSSQKETWAGYMPIQAAQRLHANLHEGPWSVSIGGYVVPQLAA